jgi:hypothetical protein
MMKNCYMIAALCLPYAGNVVAANGCVAITSAPTTISAPGHYCLANNINSSTSAIVISADDVALDCGGHVIDGTATVASSTAIGVRTNGERNNVSVKDCIIKGFAEGLVLSGFGNSITNNTVTASWARGMRVYGDNNVVRNNWITDVGGTTYASYYSAGIISMGTTDIRSNTISGVTARVSSGKGAYGIYSTSNNAGAITDNTVRNLVADGGGINLAIATQSSTNAVVINNQASNPPSTYGYAFYCTGSGTVLKGNIAQGYAYGTSQYCVDGGNNVSP